MKIMCWLISLIFSESLLCMDYYDYGKNIIFEECQNNENSKSFSIQDKIKRLFPNLNAKIIISLYHPSEKEKIKFLKNNNITNKNKQKKYMRAEKILHCFMDELFIDKKLEIKIEYICKLFPCLDSGLVLLLCESEVRKINKETAFNLYNIKKTKPYIEAVQNLRHLNKRRNAFVEK